MTGRYSATEIARLLESDAAKTSTTSGRGKTTSYAEFRSQVARGRESFSTTRDLLFWRYLTTRAVGIGPPFERDQLSPYLFDKHEQRTLSKATGPAGGCLVPQDFDNLVTSARRARNVIGELARGLETDNGRVIPLPTATAHGVGAWQAESAAGTASDETFGQVSLAAYKASTSLIVSEEFAQDALDDFDVFLADELGQRLAALEEAAFAQGDGSGKPLGIVHASSGIPTVTAANGSTTTFKLADFASALAALPAPYRASASWIMSPSAYLNAASATDSAGAPAIPSLHAAEPSLFGRPVYISAELPASAANARSAVVGDVAAGYAVRRVRGLGAQRQEEIYSSTGSSAIAFSSA